MRGGTGGEILGGNRVEGSQRMGWRRGTKGIKREWSGGKETGRRLGLDATGWDVYIFGVKMGRGKRA